MRLAPALLFALATLSAASLPARAEDAPRVATPDAATLEKVLTLQVDGEVEVDEAGVLTALTFTTPLADGLRAALEPRVRAWRFEPLRVDGQARKARAAMRITLAATREQERFDVRIDNVNFRLWRDGEAVVIENDSATVKPAALLPPHYPETALRAGVLNALVLVGVRVAPDGSVAEARVVQSALFDVKGRPRELVPYLREFERNAVAGARKWRFEVTPRAQVLAADDMTVLVPVNYMDPEASKLRPGEWRTVMRTPRQSLPWQAADMPAGAGVADVRPGEVTPLASALRLVQDVAGLAL